MRRRALLAGAAAGLVGRPALARMLGARRGAAIGVMRAADLTSKLGFSTNLNAGDYPTNIVTDMTYLGATVVRDSLWVEEFISGSWTPAYPSAASYVPIASAGFKLHLGYQGIAGVPSARMPNWISNLKTNLVIPYPGVMVGVAGPNEPDNQGFTYTDGTNGIPGANKAQADLWIAMKNDPALAGIPVDMWPNAQGYSGNLNGIASQIGDQTSVSDRVNLHDYYSGDQTNQPTFPINGPIASGPLHRYLTNNQQCSNHSTFITTESGWYVPWSGGPNYASTCNEYVKARLILDDILDHTTLTDCQLFCVYDLRDDNWGVINTDGTPKLAGTAVKNFLTVLHDAGATARTFITDPLAIGLSGMPAAGQSFTVQKSSRVFDIILWNETSIWNSSTGAQIPISSSSVTVTFPRSMTGSVYDPINSGTTPIASVSGTSTLVSLNDAPLIIEVS